MDIFNFGTKFELRLCRKVERRRGRGNAGGGEVGGWEWEVDANDYLHLIRNPNVAHLFKWECRRRLSDADYERDTCQSLRENEKS